MADIKALREKLKQKEQNNSTENTQYDNAIYPFFNIPDDSSVFLRFLPDADENNLEFWIERQICNLSFDGVVGVTDDEVVVNVPSMEMYKSSNGKPLACPIMNQARQFYKDGKDKLGSQYWKKRSYLFQGFVRKDDPLNEENPPENPIRRFIITPQIYNLIHAYVMDEDVEHYPTDFEHGADFKVIKTKTGDGKNSYITSSFSRKESALTDKELEAIETYGLFNLKDYVPKQPDEAHLKIIEEMLEASLNGEPYDPSRFANYYRPKGIKLPTSEGNNNYSDDEPQNENDAPAPSFKKTKASNDEGESSTKTKPSPKDLLAQIAKNKS